MHTLRMTLAGLALLAVFVGAAKFFPRPSWTVPRAAQMFIPVWAIVAVANMLVGMFWAGISFLVELAVLVVVFGVPAAAAWFVRQRAQSSQ
jgi:hypothetical protein